MHDQGLTVEGCRARLQRLHALMEARGVDAALITDRKHVYYYSGHLTPVATRSALIVSGSRAVLMTGTLGAAPKADGLAVSDVRTFTGNAYHSTIRPNQEELLAELVSRVALVGRVGCDLSSCPALLLQLLSDEPIDLTAGILGQRRCKDPDEVALLRVAAGCVDACYRYARERIEPGLSELTPVWRAYAHRGGDGRRRSGALRPGLSVRLSRRPRRGTARREPGSCGSSTWASSTAATAPMRRARLPYRDAPAMRSRKHGSWWRVPCRPRPIACNRG